MVNESPSICEIRGFFVSGLLSILLVSCSAQTPETPAITPDTRFSDYDIFYLSDNESELDLLSPQFIENAIGAQWVSRWSDVVVANQSGRLDALLIHASVMEEVNADELAAIYDRGVVLVFFNVYSRVIGKILGDSTIFQNRWMDGTAEPMPGDFYIIVWHLTLCRNGEMAIRTDKPLCPGSSISGDSFSRAAESLDDEQDFEFFLNVLFVKLQDN
jgi:hypothetical protein